MICNRNWYQFHSISTFFRELKILKFSSSSIVCFSNPNIHLYLITILTAYPIGRTNRITTRSPRTRYSCLGRNTRHQTTIQFQFDIRRTLTSSKKECVPIPVPSDGLRRGFGGPRSAAARCASNLTRSLLMFPLTVVMRRSYRRLSHWLLHFRQLPVYIRRTATATPYPDKSRTCSSFRRDGEGTRPTGWWEKDGASLGVGFEGCDQWQ